MYVVFENPHGWPDRMRVRDRAQYYSRTKKLKERGYEVTELACFHSVEETWEFMLRAQRRYKERRGMNAQVQLDGVPRH